MGVFDKAMKTAKNIGSSVAGTAVNVGSNVGTSAQDSSEIASLKMQINAIEQELDAAYLQIGKKYVEYVIQSDDMGSIDISDILKMMDPKMTRKKELEAQLIEVEKRVKQSDILREKANAEAAFEAEKAKLDKALSMDVISQDEYNAKLSSAQKKLDNFEEIRRVEQQCDMGIITKAERDEKIKALTE